MRRFRSGRAPAAASRAFVVLCAALLALSGCAGGAVRGRTSKPGLHGDRALVDIAAVRAFKGGAAWWAARYARDMADRSLFSTCAAPEDSLFSVAITYPNCAVFLNPDGSQRALMFTRTPEERLMWTSEDGSVLCTITSMKPKSPTMDVAIGTWRGKRLMSSDAFPAGEFFLGNSGGFVHLSAREADRDRIEGVAARMLGALTFYGYDGSVLGRDSTGVALRERSWRAAHSPEARYFAFAATWAAGEGRSDSLALFDARDGRRLWSRPLGGRPERVRITRGAERIILVAALDDSTHRISVLSGKDGRAIAEREARGGGTEDVALSCDGKLAFVAARGYRALAETGSGRFRYLVTDPSLQLHKASISNKGEAFAVNVRPDLEQGLVEAVLFEPGGSAFWRTRSDAPGPATDVWISPDGRRLFLRAMGALEIYE